MTSIKYIDLIQNIKVYASCAFILIKQILHRAIWREPIELKMGNLKIYSAPPPGSGAILTFIMNVLHRLLPVHGNVMWQRIVETFKWAYARRTELGDPAFVKGIGMIMIL